MKSIRDPKIAATIDAARATRGRSLTPSPVDWRAHWIYFLLIDRFNNPDRPPAQRWDAEVFGWQGGTFEGVRRRLDYLQGMGVGALWLSPFLKESAFCYGYGVQNYLAIDPRFGTEDDLRRLIDEAHRRGMFVLADVVIHHAGDVFRYVKPSGVLPEWSETPYEIRWRNEHGAPTWEAHAVPVDCHDDAAIWPVELRDPRFFRRHGRLRPWDPVRGDLDWLKEFDPGQPALQDLLIQVFRYWMVRLDLDGYRLDAFKHLELDFARRFCTAMREFAQSVGKNNFLLLAEVRGEIEEIVPYLGAEPGSTDGCHGADAGLLFPFAAAVRHVVHENGDCRAVSGGLDYWARCLAARRLPGGDPVSRMVTMLDDHDTLSRFFDGSDASAGDLVVGLTLLFTLPGVPCVYYGTEQGLHGRAPKMVEAVREALWGKAQAFDETHWGYQLIKRLAALRAGVPALAYGRTYVRPVAHDARNFADGAPRRILAVSRLHDESEALIVANLDRHAAWSGLVLVDRALHAEGSDVARVFSTQEAPNGAARRAATVTRVDDATMYGERRASVRAVRVELGAREVAVFTPSAVDPRRAF